MAPLLTLALMFAVWLAARHLANRVRRRAFDTVSQEEACRIVDAFDGLRSYAVWSVAPLFIALSLIVVIRSATVAEHAWMSLGILLACYLPLVAHLWRTLNVIEAPSLFRRMFLASRVIVLLSHVVVALIFSTLDLARV